MHSPLTYKTFSTRIEVNGVHIGVLQHGDASEDACPLVLLHGFTGSASSWSDLLDGLALPGLRLIAIDLLGHGQSDAPSDWQRYTIEHCQDDIITLLQTLGIAPGTAILLGYSMGGRIALYSAFSGYFRALILESASPGLPNEAEREQRRSSDDALASSIETDGLEAFVNYWEKLPLFASQNNLSPELWLAQRHQRLNNQAIGLANSLRGVGTGVQPPLHDHLPTLDLPVLLLAGELDTKFCAIAHSMARQLPQAQLQIIPGAGHTIHLERPDLFTTHVNTFCTTFVC